MALGRRKTCLMCRNIAAGTTGFDPIGSRSAFHHRPSLFTVSVLWLDHPDATVWKQVSDLKLGSWRACLAQARSRARFQRNFAFFNSRCQEQRQPTQLLNRLLTAVNFLIPGLCPNGAFSSIPYTPLNIGFSTRSRNLPWQIQSKASLTTWLA